MNLHPLFVHFPIALLSIYSVLELAPSSRLRNHPTMWQVKAFLLILGVLLGFLTLQTGEMIEYSFRYLGQVVETHSLFANLSVIVYGVLGFAYLVRVLMSWEAWTRRVGTSALWRAAQTLSRCILRPWVSILLASVGLGLLLITGALGASMVHGPGVDPFVDFVYKLFFPN